MSEAEVGEIVKRFQCCGPLSLMPALSTGIWDDYLQLPILLFGLGFELLSAMLIKLAYYLQ